MKMIRNEEAQNSMSEHKKLEPGAYVGTITNVEDCPKGFNPRKPDAGDYLKIEYDISEGPYAGNYKDLFDRYGFWGGVFYRSYKEDNINMFINFIGTVEKSNPRFSWDWSAEEDEKKLIGCKIGVVLEAEKYLGMDGSEKQKMKVKKVIAADEVKKYGKKPEPAVIVVSSDSPEQIEEDFPA